MYTNAKTVMESTDAKFNADYWIKRGCDISKGLIRKSKKVTYGYEYRYFVDEVPAITHLPMYGQEC